MEPADLHTDNPTPATVAPRRSFFLIGFILLVDFCLIVGAIVVYMAWPPSQNFPHTVMIEPGATAAEIADQLASEKIVKSSDFLYAALIAFEDPSNIKAGAHVFSEPLHVLAVADYITNNVPADELLAITFPEGFSAYEYEQFLPEAVIENGELDIDVPAVEGYLFPDTYLVPTTFSTADVFQLQQDTYNEKIAPLRTQIANSRYTEAEVIILASIIEREANDPESMGMVAGILENRISIGMPLQVDASVAYGLQKSGTELTRVDIETDGPYNTYTRNGLPPTPIANPGLAAIEAVLNPTPSEYIFYITGNDGNFYYAVTLREHNQNIADYLR